MRNARTPNSNPDVEEIMQAYLKTHMTEAQFESLVEKAIAAARGEGNSTTSQEMYDKGFSDGYDAAEKER